MVQNRSIKHVKQLSRDSGRGGSLKRGFEVASSAPLSAPEKQKEGGEAPMTAAKSAEELQCDRLAVDICQAVEEEELKAKIKAVFGLSCHGSNKTSLSHVAGVFEFVVEAELQGGAEQQREVQASTERKLSVAETRARFLQQSKEEDIAHKKSHLRSLLEARLSSLRASQTALKERARCNEAAGRAVSAALADAGARPAECDRFKLHVEEADKIASLIIGLAGRLAKAENAVAAKEDSNGEEKAQLVAKRDKLSEQLEEALKLKASIDRRASSVAAAARKHLGDDDFQRYQTFMAAKTRLVVEARDVSDKAAAAEEQLFLLTAL